MAKETNSVVTKLKDSLNDAASSLSKVVEKTMFGCHSLFTSDSIFSLVWKEGRIGVKLPDTEAYSELIKQKGAEVWQAGNRKMAHWVLVPKNMHQDRSELARWVAKAHSFAMSGVKKSETKGKKKKVRIKSNAAAKSSGARTKMARVRR